MPVTAASRPVRPIHRYRREIAVLADPGAVYTRLSTVYQIAAMLHARLAELVAREEEPDREFIEAQLTLAMVSQGNAHSYLEAALIEHAHTHPEEKPS